MKLNIFNKNKKIILFFLFILPVWLSLNCGKNNAEKIEYKEVKLPRFKNYYVSQSPNKYKCGFVCMNMWLKWIKQTGTPSSTEFIEWMDNNGYGAYVYDKGLYDYQIVEILNKAIANFLLVKHHEVIYINTRDITDLKKDLYASLQRSVPYPLMVAVDAYLKVPYQGHAIMATGYKIDKKYPDDYKKIAYFFIHDGNKKGDSGDKSYLLSDKELKNWDFLGYIKKK